MKLLIGLGNPGKEYARTRHNMGYAAADYIAEKFGFSPWQKKFQGQLCEGQIKNEKVLLFKPETYMNLSGHAVGEAAHYYKIDPSDIVVFSDDLDLPFGTTRFREGGSDGGQKGLRSIFKSLGTTDIPRLKLGISNQHRDQRETSDFVLSRLSQEELEALPGILEEGVEKMLEHF